MKTINKFFAMLVIALAGLSLAACSSDDFSTDQYGDDVRLNAFGPCPVLRGGTLFFYGSNLDQISEVDLPGADPITSIEVLATGRESKISIAVPAEKCDTGKIVLKTVTGATITSITPVTYRQDIKMESIYVGEDTKNLTGNVGDILTIKGDYLNLMHGVIFTENDTVKEEAFVAHDRYTIKVAIPAEAKSGSIKITDLAKEATELESKEAIVVNLPSVETEVPATAVKAGAVLTISGKDLDQITSVVFQGKEVEAKDFEEQTAETIKVKVPAEATDGEVSIVTKSGVKLPAGTLTTVVPSDLSAAPSPVKNGAQITVSGKDLDLVTAIAFPNAKDADCKLNVASSTKLTAVVPEAAQEGDITLTLANAKTVTVAYTLVKPTVTACNPDEIVAGNKVIVKGTDLDLVASVVFPGDEKQTVDKFSAQTAQAIALEVPAAAVGTGMTLVLKNGTEVNIDGQLTIKAATTPAVASISKAIPGETVTIKGTNFQNVQSIYIGTTKVTKYSSRSNTEIVCTVPASVAVGQQKLVIEDLDGQKIETDITVESAELDVATKTSKMDGSAITYPFSFTWSDDGRFRIMKDDLTAIGVKVGSKLIFYKEVGKTGQVQINDANWSTIESVADWDGSATQVVKVFDEKMMEAVNSTSDGWSNTAFIVQGDLTGVTKIAVLP